MKNFLIALAALGLSATALAQAPAGSDEKIVMQMEAEMAAAIMKSDVAKIEANLAPKFMFVAPDGMVSDRAKFLADIKGGVLKIVSTKNDEMNVRTFGNTAVAIYRSTDQGTYDGQDISGQYRWSDTFVKDGARWKLVSSHGTALPPPEPPRK